MSMLKTFEDLDVYKKCREFRQDISQLVKTLPNTENHKLQSQLLRSSRAVTSSIAEGFGRFHHLENIQFCRQSRGSLMETLEHLIIANDEGFISAETLEDFRMKQNDCMRTLNAYISYLKKAKNRAFESAPATPYVQDQQFQEQQY
ncbi:MAG TPA: four helix bundle protein [Flavobacteriales bacterium]|nr:four helix bundle protein [Flavobacteriales bacterium]HRE97387.1 four helix bundle protein [Flavobacteriales bacterium]HRJ35891.1 four helix bundle protein [Flavobacteriales bacterium]HRJ40012.1 four helix bundle protein [Flavobacteriales bacterium]